MHSRITNLLLIRDNEKNYVMYFFLLYTVLGCGIAFGRNSTDVLFFKRFGVDYLPLMYVIFSVFLALASIIYAAFADRLAPERLSIIIFGTLICLLVGNWAWISFGTSSTAYPAYFLLYEIASEILIVHSAHYLSQNFNALQAKRLFPLIMAGTQVGIVIGSIVIAVSAAHVRIQEILLVWCLMLVICIVMIVAWHRKHGTSAHFRSLHKSNARIKQSLSQITYGFTLIKQSRMLRSASFALFFMVITFYILCYSVNRIYTQTFTSEAELSSFFGMLTATTNGIALFLQLFITNRIIHKFGVKKVNLFFPLTSMVTYLTLLTSYSLVPAILGSINKDAIMPAFRNPVRTIFFSTLPENVQGRARATSVVIVLPLALFVCGLMLILLQKAGAQQYFLVLGLLSAGVYLFFNHQMNKEYINEILSTLRSKVMMPNSALLDKTSNKAMAPVDFLNNGNTERLFNMLMESYPDKGQELIALREENYEDNLTDQLIRILSPINPPGFSDVLWELYQEQHDTHLQSTILTILFQQRDKRVLKLIPELLQNDRPRIVVSAIIGALHQDNVELRKEALNKWQSLLGSNELSQQLASLELIEYLYLIPDPHQSLLPLYKSLALTILKTGKPHQVAFCLRSLQYWPESQFPEIAEELINNYHNSNVPTRVLCTQCCSLTYNSDQTLLYNAIEDSSPRVRLEAARVHFDMAGEDANEIFMIWLATEANGSPLAQKAYLELFHELSADDEKFVQIALGKAELAQQFFVGHQILKKHEGEQSAAFQLVKHILQERIKQYIELSVYAIQGYERDDHTRLLTTCVNSRDARHIANACEVLRNFKHQKLGQILSDLVDNKPINFNRIANPKFTQTINSVLEWCKNLPDPWLSRCAKEALKYMS